MEEEKTNKQNVSLVIKKLFKTEKHSLSKLKISSSTYIKGSKIIEKR